MSALGGGGDKCKVCEKTSYPAETVYFEKTPYHVECFRCSSSDGCGKKIESAGGAMLFETALYCKHCFNKNGFAQKQKNVAWVKKESTGASTSKFGGGGNPCQICTKTVFAGEAVSFEKMIFHPECFKCSESDDLEDKGCGKKISSPSDAAKWDQNDAVHILCRKCFSSKGYNRKQALKGGSGTATKTNSLASRFGGGGTPCQICTKSVYAGEALSFEKMIFHPGCFQCSTSTDLEDPGCGKKMANASDAAKWDQDGTIHVLCRKCFSSKGYNRKQAASGASGGSGAKTNALASKFGGGGASCQICSKTVYAGEALSFDKMSFHPDCFKCSEPDCGKKMSPSDGAKWEEENGDISVKCRKCFVDKGYNRRQKVTQNASSANSAASKFGGGGEKCEICEKTVYPAETVAYEKKIYHGDCFKCVCGKKLEVNNANFHKEHGLHCSKCWNEKGLFRAENA